MANNSSSDSVFKTSLYVGDLHPNVDESKLRHVFAKVGAIKSVKVCRDILTRNSLGYGYVNFFSNKDATLAMENLNNTPLYGKLIRVAWSQRDPVARRSGVGNVFVKNLDESIDNVGLYDIFSSYGKILSCKVAMTPEGTSKAFGFVQFETEESSKRAIAELHGITVAGKKIYVAPFVRKSERESSFSSAPGILRFTNVYIKHLDPEITEEILKEKFSKFGSIKKLVILRDEYGCSKGVGFVDYDNHDSAKQAIDGMNGTMLGSMSLYVARAQKKEEREKVLSHRFEKREEKRDIYKEGLNVYVKNIHDEVGEEEFRQLFSSCGTVHSSKIMRDEKGMCKGFGFVCFSNLEEAQNAVNGLHGYMLYNKPLYVNLAERKEERLAKWKMQFQQKVAAMIHSQEAAAANFPTFYYPTSSVEGPLSSPQNGDMFHGMVGVPSMGLQSHSGSEGSGQYRQQYGGQENLHTMLASGVQGMPLYQPAQVPSVVPHTTNYQKKRARIADKKKRIAKDKSEAAEYHKLLTTRLKEQRERCSKNLVKKRSRLSAASKPSIDA